MLVRRRIMTWKYYHRVWVIMAGGWVALYLIRMGLAPLLGMIMEEFKLSHAMAGVLFSAIFYSYGLMQLPSGYLGDRFGRKKILVVATSLWFLLSLVTAAAQTLTMLLVARIFTGLAHGLYFGNERPTVTAFTPKDKMGQGQGISFMGLCAGLFLSVFFAGMIAEYFRNWRIVFLIFSIPSLVVSILIFKFITEPPKTLQGEKPLTARAAYREALVDGNLWLMYILGFVLLFAYWVIIAWLPSIYEEIGIGTITSRSLLTGIIGLIGLPAMFISGIMSDKMTRKGYGRKWFIAIMIFLWALLMLWIGFAVKSGASIVLISSLFFSSAFVVFGVWPPYYALLSEMAPVEVVGTVFGVANFIGFLSTWIAPILTGWIKDQTGSFAGGLFLASAMLITGTIVTLALRSPQNE